MGQKPAAILDQKTTAACAAAARGTHFRFVKAAMASGRVDMRGQLTKSM